VKKYSAVKSFEKIDDKPKSEKDEEQSFYPGSNKREYPRGFASAFWDIKVCERKKNKKNKEERNNGKKCAKKFMT